MGAIRFGWMLIFSLMLVGCSSNSGSSGSPRPQSTTKTFIKGDPGEVIRGASLNATSFLTTENISNINGFAAIMHVFEEVGESANIYSQGELEKANETKEEAEEVTSVFKVKPVKYEGEDGYLYTIDGNRGFLLLPSEEDPKILEFRGAVDVKKNEAEAITVLHYSVKPDLSSFSILYKDGEAPNRSLTSIVFTKPLEGKFVPTRVPAGIELLNGQVKFAWDQTQPLAITLCGAENKRFEAVVASSWSSWAQVLDGRLELRGEISEACPPFSDVNVHGIYLVNAYRASDSARYVHLMDTFALPDLRTNGFLDSDIVIYRLEVEKYIDGYVKWEDKRLPRFLTRSFQHEMGHVLGLGHKFPERVTTASGQKTEEVESIMSYNSAHDRISPYDVLAVQTIYPKR